MKILFIGDIVSSSGRNIINRYLKDIKNKYEIDFVIANGENSAHGKGITEKIYLELLSYGIDVITLGNHFLLATESLNVLDRSERLVRPLNIHSSIPGSGSRVFNVKGHKVRVTNLLGKVFINDLNPSNPFDAIDAVLESSDELIHFVDLHAEATAEKLSIGWYLDGKVSAVVGTHTHVPTADERILPNGTAYLTDVGMTGPYDGIIGTRRDLVIHKQRTGLPTKFDIQEGEAQLCACVIDIDEETGKSRSIFRININRDHINY